FRVFESVIPSGDHDNHLKEFSKNPNKGYYKHARDNLKNPHAYHI
ncbi:MAG: hypothetical protein PWQ32_1506, partial [Thermococcaceae archaeon]|nr:hypothetical protein [Thermococcaceae archaeon]